MFVTTGSPAVSLALRLHGHKCMQARIHDDATVTLSRARPSFHSCKYTLLAHFFFKGNAQKKHWIIAGQWAKAGHHGNKLRATRAGCVFVCVRWEGV